MSVPERGLPLERVVCPTPTPLWTEWHALQKTLPSLVVGNDVSTRLYRHLNDLTVDKYHIKFDKRPWRRARLQRSGRISERSAAKDVKPFTQPARVTSFAILLFSQLHTISSEEDIDWPSTQKHRISHTFDSSTVESIQVWINKSMRTSLGKCTRVDLNMCWDLRPNTGEDLGFVHTCDLLCVNYCVNFSVHAIVKNGYTTHYLTFHSMQKLTK